MFALLRPLLFWKRKYAVDSSYETGRTCKSQQKQINHTEEPTGCAASQMRVDLEIHPRENKWNTNNRREK